MKVQYTNGIGGSWEEDSSAFRFFCTGCTVGCKDCQPARFAEPKKAGPVGTIGWVCPQCGQENSPYAFHCNCGPHVKIYDSTGTGD